MNNADIDKICEDVESWLKGSHSSCPDRDPFGCLYPVMDGGFHLVWLVCRSVFPYMRTRSKKWGPTYQSAYSCPCCMWGEKWTVEQARDFLRVWREQD